MSGERVRWLVAFEPLVDDALAWTLLRATEAEQQPNIVAAGVTRDLTALRRRIEDALPQITADADDLWRGPLTDSVLESELMTEVGHLLLPAELRTELFAGGRHTVHLQTRGWSAFVPWDALAVGDADVRLIEAATVLTSLSPTVQAGRARRAVPDEERPALRLIDPGPPNHRELPTPIYPGVVPDCWYEGEGDRVTVADADWLIDADALSGLLRSDRGWSRLFYFGHVLPATRGAPARVALVLHEHERAERLTAFRMLADPGRWPMPHRVAFIGCASNDTNYLEQSGLTIAAYNAGAELITTTRWTLPIDRPAVGELSGATRLALAVDRAHASVDPVEALRSWQLDRLHGWRRQATAADAPVLWASLTTTVAPGSRPW